MNVNCECYVALNCAAVCAAVYAAVCGVCCCAVLCCAVLCCAVLCCAVLCAAVCTLLASASSADILLDTLVLPSWEVLLLLYTVKEWHQSRNQSLSLFKFRVKKNHVNYLHGASCPHAVY
jgi:hypothetical protein